MHGPALPGWLLVALGGLTGAYCLLRFRGCSGEARRAAGDEALMGIGMALMAVPAAALTPPRWTWTGYAAVFGGAALASLWAARRGAHHLHHLVGSLAMVYMAVAMARPGGGAAGHGAHASAAADALTGLPLVTGALLAYYAVYVLRSGIRLVPAGAAAPSATTALPDLLPACRLAMGLGMLAMLSTM
ncbi:DUF5134 domain-containing protein [Streptomyces sp. NPDC047315]|uniref:DUF5134 domain-containing protein n=1 Tax=Streptomyces sp. NPDC047315 TaxID=3155142 RepID=UPI0033E94BE1